MVILFQMHWKRCWDWIQILRLPYLTFLKTLKDKVLGLFDLSGLFGGDSGGGTGGSTGGGFGLLDCAATDFDSPSLPEPETDTSVEVPPTNECVVGTIDCSFGSQQLIISDGTQMYDVNFYNTHQTANGGQAISNSDYTGKDGIYCGQPRNENGHNLDKCVRRYGYDGFL